MRSNELPITLSAVWIALVLCASPVHAAPPTAADKAQAQRLYVEGKALRDEGKPAEAIVKLRASHDLAPTPVTRLELAKMLVATSKLVEGHGLLASIASLPVAATETSKSAAARKEAETLAASVLARIPRLTVRVVSAQEGAAVTLDGAPLDAARLGAEQQVDPGTHVGSLRVGERTTERTVSLAEGEAKTMDLELEAIAAPRVALPPVVSPVVAKPVKPDPVPAPAAPAAESGGGSVAVPIAFTIAGIGLATGAVTGIVAMTQAGDLKNACARKVCVGDDADDLKTHQAFTTTSTIAFALGGAAAAVGVVLLVVEDDAPRPKTAFRARWAGTSIAMEGTWN